MKKEDYVSLEVAKLLKDKGYNEYCGAYYHLNWEDVAEEERFEIAPNHDFRNRDNGYRVGAPTLYEASKWLRENKNILITTFGSVGRWLSSLKYADTGYCIMAAEALIDNMPEMSDFCDTYEEALNAGILTALKLI